MAAVSGMPSTAVVVVGFAAYLIAFVLPREGLYDLALTPLLGEHAIVCGAAMKALPVLLLSLDAWHAAGAVEHRSRAAHDYSRYISFGLALGALGDVCLDLGDDFFIPGLLSFLCGHGWYAFAFLRDGVTHSAAVAIAISGVVCGMIAVLVPCVPVGMVVPVCVYAGVIGVMAYTAVTRHTGVTRSYMAATAGSLLFMLSDAMLAVGKFKYENRVRFTKLLVMLTYYAAQYAVCASATALASAAAGEAPTASSSSAAVDATTPTVAAAAGKESSSKGARKRK